MGNNKLPYEKIIEDGSIQYKITIENILGGLYGNIFKNNERVHTEEISNLVRFSLLKTHGEDFPLKYLKDSLEKQIEEYKNKNPENIVKKIIDNLKEKNDDKKYSLKELSDNWLSLNNKLREEVYKKIEDIKDDDIIVEYDSMKKPLLQNKSANMKAKKIYLDMNIFTDYMDSSRPNHIELKQRIDKLKKEYTFLYSPAHMEEVARGIVLEKDKDENKTSQNAYKILKNISELTNNYEVLPTYESTIIKQEHPKECLERVFKDYDATVFVERLNTPTKCRKEQNKKFKEKWNIIPKEIGNIEPEELFSNYLVRNIFNHYLEAHNENIEKWNTIKNSHKKVEETISSLFAFLDDIGYKKGTDKQSISNIHDNTHAIYATVSDIFITSDEKFCKRVKAIYSFLGVETSVYSKEEFLKEEF